MDVVDVDRLRSTLGDPALSRLVDRLQRRLELGRPLTGAVTLSGLSETERRALRGLLGSGRVTGASTSVDLAAVAATLRAARIAPDLAAAVRALRGDIVARDETALAEATARAGLVARLAGSVHAGQPWYDTWVRQLDGDGTLTRHIRSGAVDRIGQAVAVLDRLPAGSPIPLPVLAEQATGDTKALGLGEPLCRLVLRALALREGSTAPPAGREAQRELWLTAGVIVDDLASQVLVLNLRATGGAVAGWLDEAASLGMPFRLTLHQQTVQSVIPAATEIFVCENPAVLRAAAAAGAGECSAPLICTEGVPSAACHTLLTAAVSAGARLRWRADFDWAGVRIVGAGIERYAAVPWRMAVDDYVRALEQGESEPLGDGRVEAAWDPALTPAMAAAGRAVMEERLIPELLTDLKDARIIGSDHA